VVSSPFAIGKQFSRSETLLRGVVAAFRAIAGGTQFAIQHHERAMRLDFSKERIEWID
jgi:hypothetical protein